MKKIFFSVAILAAGMMFTSCSETLLDTEQKGVGDSNNFFKTDEDAKSSVTAMYDTYCGEIAGTEGIWNAYLTGINYHSDDILAAGNGTDDHADFRIMNEMRYDASSKAPTQLFNHIYLAVYTSNVIIENYGSGTSQVMKQAVAEARVMRAWAHMLAALVYYQPPLVDHIVGEGEYLGNDMSQKDILNWCIKECEEAMADLPERKGADDKEGAWVVTKGFAQFVAAKSALYAEDYQKCANLIKPLVESSNYALVPGEKFRDLFHVEGDGCSEKIFEFNYVTNTSAAGGSDSWRGGNNRGRWMVANVFNWRNDDLASKPKICGVAGWGGGAIQQDFAHKMLDNDGDSYRRKATFLTSDEFMYDAKLCPWGTDVEAGGKLSTRAEKEFDKERGMKNTGGSFSRSDVMEVKMIMSPSDVAENNPAGDNCNQTNVCLARLAEAYLIYAEACIKNGNLDEAKKYINKIQERAGSKTVTESLTAENAMQVLMDEKQYELWFEGCRWFDIVRWGIAKKCFDKVLDNIPYQFDEYFTSGGTKPHKLVYEVRHPFAAIKVPCKFTEGKNEYWPLPQVELDVNKSLHQVRGWASTK